MCLVCGVCPSVCVCMLCMSVVYVCTYSVVIGWRRKVVRAAQCLLNVCLIIKYFNNFVFKYFFRCIKHINFREGIVVVSANPARYGILSIFGIDGWDTKQFGVPSAFAGSGKLQHAVD